MSRLEELIREEFGEDGLKEFGSGR